MLEEVTPMIGFSACGWSPVWLICTACRRLC